MKPTEAARIFIQEYFDARTAKIERELTAHQPFREQFYAENCIWDSRPLAVELSKSERIVSIEESNNSVVLVTSRFEYSPKLRYTLQNNEGRWLISCIAPECALCRGTGGKLDCEICRGSGWLPLPDN